MSYILDALRKAEKDRNLGKTPSLGDVMTPPARAPDRRPSTRVLALCALVVGLLVLTVLLWPRAPQKTAPTVVAAAAPPAAPAPLTQVTPPASAVESTLTPPAAVDSGDPALDSDVAAESIDDLLDETDTDEASASLASAAVDEGIPAQPDPEASVPVAAETKPRTVAAAPPAAEAPPPSAPPEPAPVEGVPSLRDMPSDYRAAFPELRVDVHVYDDDPARRWALINGKKAVEGAAIAEGPTVSEITPEGIIFDFRGSKALFPLNR